MTISQTILRIFAAVVGVSLLLYAFLLFDRIVRAEYEENRTAWESDGKPVGFFWRPPEGTWFLGGWARNRLSLAWLFIAPPWICAGTDCRRWLNHFRLCVWGWNALVLINLFVTHIGMIEKPKALGHAPSINLSICVFCDPVQIFAASGVHFQHHALGKIVRM